MFVDWFRRESFELKIYAYIWLCRLFGWFSNNISESKSKSIEQKSSDNERKLSFETASIGQNEDFNF